MAKVSQLISSNSQRIVFSFVLLLVDLFDLLLLLSLPRIAHLIYLMLVCFSNKRKKACLLLYSLKLCI